MTSVNPIILEEGYYRLGPGVRVTTDVDEFDASYGRGLVQHDHHAAGDPAGASPARPRKPGGER